MCRDASHTLKVARGKAVLKFWRISAGDFSFMIGDQVTALTYLTASARKQAGLGVRLGSILVSP